MISYPQVVQDDVVEESFDLEPHTLEDIQDWIVNHLAGLLEIEPEEIDPTIAFDRYGLDSAAAIGLTGDLEDWLGQEIEPTLLYDYPTVVSLAEYLCAQ